ncbi:MAG TPA: 2Fe-2S iron-sulfur cluster-binding protein [Noviherbaspirillum sp.]
MTTKHATFSVVIQPGGMAFDAPGSASLLSAARDAGIDLPASCRNGTCRTCMCALVSGRVRYNIEWPGLSPEEKRDGYILPCVALPESDVVIHVPGARLLKPA